MKTVARLLLTCLFVASAQAKYSGGTGEPNDPYQIATAADLIALGETPGDYDKHFILTADIDLDPNLPGRKVFDKAVIAPDVNDMNWYFDGTPFTGIFEGNGHKIWHLTIKGSSYLGLFGAISWPGGARNLGVLDHDIVGSRGYVGALVAENGSNVTQCYGTGVIGGKFVIGGLVGDNHGIVSQCYSTGMVSVANTMGRPPYAGGGGLVGSNEYGLVTCCYSTGAVTGSGSLGGGLVGYGGWYGHVKQCFWDTQTSGQATSDGGTGKTTAEMQMAITFLEAGWDFVGETANGTEDIWKIAEGLGYPRLAWEKYSGGTGEPNDPYQIATATDLIALGETPADYDKHFILTADIDLDPNLPGRKVFDSAVVPGFRGVFIGNGHVISHLTAMGVGYVGNMGLFGVLNGKVKSLGLVDVSIHGSGDYVGDVGGLAGWNCGDVTQCYSTGTVSGNKRVGGLVGLNEGSLANCYSIGLVRGVCHYPTYSYPDVGVGGLVGVNQYIVERSYSAAATSGNHEYVGGLLGLSWASGGMSGSGHLCVDNCFWDTQTSGQATRSDGIGMTTAEMQTAKTFLDAGWDFLGEIENGLHEVWTMPEGGGYPVLAIFNGYTPPVLQGLGTAASPYMISDAVDLGAIVHYSASAHYRLGASIDLSGIRWGTAVIPWFRGTFDGDSHSISHLTMTGGSCGSYGGMFGRLESGAEIRRLGVVDVNIAAPGVYAGGLVGYSEYSTVTQCYSTGVVRGGDYIGGLVGCNGSGEVSYSYSTATVIGDDHTAGLVGVNSSLLGPPASVIHCYSTGAVSHSRTGPFSRENPGPIGGGLVSPHNYHYSGSVMACFWDTQTSRQITSDGGTGKTTAEMQTAKTFTDAGWDFMGETANGTEDIWWIDEGKDYPRLWWERNPEN
jgi:hypothetical protein